MSVSKMTYLCYVKLNLIIYIIFDIMIILLQWLEYYYASIICKMWLNCSNLLDFNFLNLLLIANYTIYFWFYPLPVIKTLFLNCSILEISVFCVSRKTHTKKLELKKNSTTLLSHPLLHFSLENVEFEQVFRLFLLLAYFLA